MSGQRASILGSVVALAAFGCEPAERERTPRAAASSTAPVSLSPRPSSPFDCDARACVQQHPRLPDTGEWRCAERERVVWCAGGEPAAGVVSGPADPGYRCGKRWGRPGSERICIDTQPDFPFGQREGYACRFVQERGIARHCAPDAAQPRAAPAARAVPGCWLDRDCPSGRCDRGNCACASDADCELGRCRQSACVEDEP